MDRFAEGQPIIVYPKMTPTDYPEDFAEQLTDALAVAGIDWYYA